MPTQSTDITSPMGPTLEFTLLDETWTIDTGVTVTAQSGDAVVNSNPQLAGSTLINNGNILADNSAVTLAGQGSAITNNAGHNMIGGSVGITFDGEGTITNHGFVAGLSEAGIFLDDTLDFMLTNTGEIYGRDLGIGALSGTTGGTINNSGVIHFDNAGIAVASTAGSATVINNNKGGTIAGGAGVQGIEGAIVGGGGRIELTNRGTIDGDIVLMASAGNVDDTIMNKAKGNILGEVHLGDGNDVFIGKGGKKVVLFGEGDDDKLVASRARDKLDGGDGNDILTGHHNKDFQTGGLGTDRFDFNSIKDSLKGGKRDKILDFDSSENDMIDLRGIDAKMGSSGNQKFKWIGKQGFHDKEGELRYVKKGANALVEGDVNGDGKADFQIQLQDVSALNKGDFIL